jgi:hypothetical protein
MDGWHICFVPSGCLVDRLKIDCWLYEASSGFLRLAWSPFVSSNFTEATVELGLGLASVFKSFNARNSDPAFRLHGFRAKPASSLIRLLQSSFHMYGCSFGMFLIHHLEGRKQSHQVICLFIWALGGLKSSARGLRIKCGCLAVFYFHNLVYKIMGSLFRQRRQLFWLVPL